MNNRPNATEGKEDPAMTQNLARVGDKIQYGEPLPGNVVQLRDAESVLWGAFSVEDGEAADAWRWPMKVTQVTAPDPGPDDYATKSLLELVKEYGDECVAGGSGATSDDSAVLFEEIARRLDALRSEGEGFDWIATILDGAR